jgi:hypothetical protein
MSTPRVSFMRTGTRTFGVTLTALSGWVWLEFRCWHLWVTLYLCRGNHAD